jgi:two-component system, OmpR family, phosphate regulon sensor histidine kinase PhoR
MKKKNTVLILGISAILILILAQVIIIRALWKQQEQTIRVDFRDESRRALQGQTTMQYFDTVYLLVNRYAAKKVLEFQGLKDTSLIKQKKNEVLTYFKKVLNQEEDLSPYLSSYFEKTLGFKTNFTPRLEITNLILLDGDSIKIFTSDFQRNNRQGGFQGSGSSESGSSIFGIMVRPFFQIGNNYILSFDYFIDFSDKKKLILREISASLAMSIFSIIAIVVMFIITYRNLREEKRLSNLKTDFINNMTHELKTPLATITVAGKTLEMERIRQDDAKILETAKMIGKQSVHLNQLINMILEISMWERTEFQLDKKVVDIEEVLNDIVYSFSSGSGSVAKLNQKYDLNGIRADIDVVYFTTMINNLLSNAVKYSEKQPEIIVEGKTDDRFVSISVADNGIGISKSDQKHVFDKFYRASSGNIHKYKGLGLGLYYVKKIAVAHGGDVTVSSKPGKGSIFTVTIPY